MKNENQRRLIETEMATLIRELQQLKEVREALEQQAERKTVRYYLLNGGIAGRYFVGRPTPDFPQTWHYRILDVVKGAWPVTNLKIKSNDVKFISIHLSEHLEDEEAAI